LVDTASFLEKSHHCLPSVVVAVQGDKDASSSLAQSTNHLFLVTSSFWSPLHLTLVPVPGSRDENTETITGAFHLTVKNKHDTKVLAVLTISENIEKEKHIVWTRALDE
jgi:hypothetical protein